MFKGLVEHENGKRIKKVRTDNDEEYINNKIKSIFFSMIASREKWLLDMLLKKVTLLKERLRLYRNETWYDTDTI